MSIKRRFHLIFGLNCGMKGTTLSWKTFGRLLEDRVTKLQTKFKKARRWCSLTATCALLVLFSNDSMLSVSRKFWTKLAETMHCFLTQKKKEYFFLESAARVCPNWISQVWDSMIHEDIEQLSQTFVNGKMFKFWYKMQIEWRDKIILHC